MHTYDMKYLYVHFVNLCLYMYMHTISAPVFRTLNSAISHFQT